MGHDLLKSEMCRVEVWGVGGGGGGGHAGGC